MPDMARKQGSHSDITRPRLMETALRLIARHGFAAVSMRQIASEVGVQVGALYNYIPDKQTLLFDLMRGHLDDLLAAVDAANLTGDALTRLESFAKLHIRFNLPRADNVFVAYMELRNLSDENFAVIEHLRRKYEDTLEAILKDGLQEGVFDVADTRIATLALIGMLSAMNTWYREGGRLATEQIETLYWDLVRKSVAK